MKQARLLFIFGLMFLLTGCVQKYDYSEAQSDEAAEYIAGLLLENDKDYTQELMPIDDLMGTSSSDASTSNDTSIDTPTVATSSGNSTSASTAEPEKEYSLTEVLGLKDFELRYSDYKIMDTYPEDKSLDYFSITPTEGNQLVVISFMLTNTSKKERTVDIKKAALKYQLDINDGTVYEPLFTVLENDLKYLNTSLKGGEEKPVILIVEVKKEKKMKDIKLTVSNGDKTNIIKMK
jgi:hypothetical protein